MKVPRLVVSIYIVALVQLLTAWLGFSISRDYLVEPLGRLGRGGWEAFAAQHVAYDRGDPVALRDTMDWLEVELGIHLTLFGPDGQVLASNHAPPPAPLPAKELGRLPDRGFLPGPGPDRLTVGIRDQGKLVAYVISDRFRFRRPLSRQMVLIAVVLSVVLLGSLFFARSLAVPLRQLKRTARDFGNGELGARARLNRQDELGELGNAFDDMAERITALLRSQRELLTNVSHELRSPLARIRVALDLASLGDAEAAHDALANINVDWGDLDHLVEDVLAAARLDLRATEPGSFPLRRDVVRLVELAESASERHRAAYPNEHLTLEVAPGLPDIEGDAALLRRVVDNLIDNARKYSDPMSPVTLRIEPQAGNVTLTVSDHGMGIETDDLPHIFRPFFRADRSRTRKTGGVGMGLALVRRIVIAHGGRIDVKSVVGTGTEIRVQLPVNAKESSAHFRTLRSEFPHTVDLG